MADRPLPHLQFAVLAALGSTKRAGREIREELRALDLKKSGPAFYRLMTRLEEAGFVEGWYEQEVVDGGRRIGDGVGELAGGCGGAAVEG